MTDPGLEPLFAFLREHSGGYSPEILRGQLLQNGHDPATVDRAMAIYQQGGLPPPEVPGRSKLGRIVLGIFLGIVALIALFILVVGGLCLLYVKQQGR